VIGLERASLRDVAAMLGVTTPGLYYHIRTRDDLLRLVLSRMTSQLFGEAPEDAVSFRHALTRFAHGLFCLLRDHPQLLPQIMGGHIPGEHVAAHSARLLAQADADHFGRADAMRIVEGVTAATIGAAVMEASRSIHRDDPLMVSLAQATAATDQQLWPVPTGDTFRIVESVIARLFS
jgi:AcrR family transcriptional regulator